MQQLVFIEISQIVNAQLVEILTGTLDRFPERRLLVFFKRVACHVAFLGCRLEDGDVFPRAKFGVSTLSAYERRHEAVTPRLFEADRAESVVLSSRHPLAPQVQPVRPVRPVRVRHPRPRRQAVLVVLVGPLVEVLVGPQALQAAACKPGYSQPWAVPLATVPAA
jgi:hypothetical protein